jgi:nitrous oxide reductase accessory protein NosL
MSILAEIPVDFNAFGLSSTRYCHVHFDTEGAASSFYYLYQNNKHTICKQLKNVVIRPSRDNGVDVIYVSYFNVANWKNY